MGMNFADVLTTKISDVERPPLLPIGTYRARVSKVPSMDSIADGRFDVCDFTLQLQEAVEVDEDELAPFGDLTKQTVQHRFMFNTEDEANFKRTLFNLRRFLEEHLGCASDGDELKVALNNSVNSECLIDISHRPDQNDPEVKYVQVRRTAPVE